MAIENVHQIEGVGTVVTGRVERGRIRLKDQVEILGLMRQPRRCVVTGLEVFHQTMDVAIAGDNVGALLRGVKKDEVERGQVLARPGSLTPRTKFLANVFVLSKEEGGRHTPFFSGYRPQLHFRTTDVTGTVTLPEGIEMFQKTLDKAIAGDNVGALLRGIDRDGIERGQVIAKPGSITPHTKFEGNIYVLSKDEGGRHTPFFTGYKPQFYFRTTDVTGSITLPAGVEMCMPGDNVKITVELMEGMPVAMDEGLRFAIREGGKTVGSGVVTKILV